MAIIYTTCHAPRYFRKTQDTNMDRRALVTLEVARNRRNFHCARSRIAILLASLIFINSRRRQTKCTLPTSMLSSSVVKAFCSKTWCRDRRRRAVCQNMSKNRFRKIGLMFASNLDCHICIFQRILQIWIFQCIRISRSIDDRVLLENTNFNV